MMSEKIGYTYVVKEVAFYASFVGKYCYKKNERRQGEHNNVVSVKAQQRACETLFCRTDEDIR